MNYDGGVCVSGYYYWYLSVGRYHYHKLFNARVEVDNKRVRQSIAYLSFNYRPTSSASYVPYIIRSSHELSSLCILFRTVRIPRSTFRATACSQMFRGSWMDWINIRTEAFNVFFPVGGNIFDVSKSVTLLCRQICSKYSIYSSCSVHYYFFPQNCTKINKVIGRKISFSK